MTTLNKDECALRDYYERVSHMYGTGADLNFDGVGLSAAIAVLVLRREMKLLDLLGHASY